MSASSWPAGSRANAWSVGANTVNGPAPFRVSTRPACCSALTSVVRFLAAIAVSTMSIVAMLPDVLEPPVLPEVVPMLPDVPDPLVLPEPLMLPDVDPVLEEAPPDMPEPLMLPVSMPPVMAMLLEPFFGLMDSKVEM